ncbi:MAG: type I restriction endonuclease subunit R [Selenomonadaceae bacterium]|nr:type I restriction endonuclease subunit R [Selenomonadaceae bacterium]
MTFNRELALDTVTLLNFIRTTQADEWQRLCKLLGDETEKLFVQEFCAHVEQVGMLQTLRDGFDVHGCKFRAVYWRPETSVNPELVERYGQNIFTCVQQLHYGTHQKLSDAVFFVNGLPLVTVELKDSLAGQTFDDAVEHYKRDCDPSEKFFQFDRRTLIHFAADNYRAAVTTKLESAATKFLPFNPDSNGADNPSANVLREILRKNTLLELLQNYLLVDGEQIIFPCRHQSDVVTKLLTHVRSHGAGRNYLIQHSAGKSRSMAWLAQRLTNLRDAADEKIFNSVLVVTDRSTLERKLQDTVTQIERTPGLVVKVNTSAELRDALNGGKKIIVMTLKIFLATYREVIAANKKFAIIIDEAHLSQSDAASKIKPSPTDKTLADEDFLTEDDRA